MVSRWYQVKNKILGITVVHLGFFPDLFVSANCTAHHERPAQTKHLQCHIIYLLSFLLLLHPVPFPSPSSQGFLCLCLSNLFPLRVGTSLWHMLISPARARRQNLSPLSMQSRWADKGALGTPTVRRQ